MQPSKQNFLSTPVAIVLIVSAFLLGFFIRGQQSSDINHITEVSGKTDSEIQVDFSPFWKAWRILNEKQIDGSGTSTEDKLWSSIQGLTQSYGDPYTVFFPPQEAKAFEEEISGNFEGVGMEVGIKDEIITVVAPLKNTPAERAGIRAGDKIVRIDDTSTINMTIDDAVEMIRGEKGTTVVLTVLREGIDDSLEIPITRASIQVPTLDTELRSDGVFVISFYSFSANATDEFRDSLREFVNSGSDKLLLDLRGNPGGYLSAAVDIASYFLPNGKVVVREVGKDKEEIDVLRSRGYDLLKNKDFDMVVLVDQGSASASEILAGALSEHGVATLVGMKTFGKGSVQEVVPITLTTRLKVTIAEWLTPEGVSISEEGLAPEIEVEWTPDETNPDYDNQLEKAVEILLNN